MDTSLLPPDLQAAHHLLADPVLAPARGGGLDWDALFARSLALPPPAGVLVATAYELAEARRALSLWEIPAGLDAAGMQRVVEALCLSHGGVGVAPEPWRVARGPRPADHAAVAHGLASPRLADRVAGHVHPDGFDWFRLLAAAETMSRGQRLLVDIAHDLWTRGDAVSVREVARSLDTGSFIRVVEALAASREAFALPLRRPRLAA